MNAYELADWTKEQFSRGWINGYLNFFREIEGTLRQQADRIAELEVTKFHLEGDVNRLEDQVNELLVAKHFKDIGRTK